MKNFLLAAGCLLPLSFTPSLGSSYDDLNRGIQLHNEKQWGASIEAFDAALALDNLPVDQKFIAYLDRGQAHAALRQYDKALSDFTTCLALKPANEMALLERANTRTSLGDLPEAVADLDALIRLRPLLVPPYMLRSVINARLGHPGQSVEDSRKILSLLPTDVRNIEMGIIAWQAGELDVADSNFSFVNSQSPDNIFAWLWLALTYARQGKAVPRDHVPKIAGTVWPAPLVSYFSGDVDADAVLAAASEGSPSVSQSHMCEAHFYIGEWLVQHSDAVNGKLLLRKASDECPVNFVEWAPAQTDLAELTQ